MKAKRKARKTFLSQEIVEPYQAKAMESRAAGHLKCDAEGFTKRNLQYKTTQLLFEVVHDVEVVDCASAKELRLMEK